MPPPPVRRERGALPDPAAEGPDVKEKIVAASTKAYVLFAPADAAGQGDGRR